MKISDNGIILFSKKIQEKLLLLKIFSENHGLCSGIAKNISTKKVHNYQIGNLVKFQKYSRMTDQLGVLSCESIRSFQWHIISCKRKLYSFTNISNLILGYCAEFEPHEHSYNVFSVFLENLTEEKFSWLKYFNTEIELLRDAGYGLQLHYCAVTNETENLVYVSPKTGRAISQNAAKNYEHLLLKLPKFLAKGIEPKEETELDQAFTLLDYFFYRYIWKNKASDEIAQARALLKSSFSL